MDTIFITSTADRDDNVLSFFAFVSSRGVLEPIQHHKKKFLEFQFHIEWLEIEMNFYVE